MAAALFGKRSTRFRHVYGSPAQKENCYDNIRVSGNAHDSMFCAVNRQYLGIVTEFAGGGGFTVLPISRTGRIDHNAPKVSGHSAPVMDIKWNPFNDNVIASASDDATVKIWEIPKQGIFTDLTQWSVDLKGHARRVAYLEWHPTAENILLSAGFDHSTILWNCEVGSPILTSNCHNETIQSISWNRDGSLYASTCKDRKARVVDPRTGKAVISFEPHQGNKTTKILFLGDTKQLFTTGFSQFAQRQYGLWDMRNAGQGAIKQENVDSASGILFPFYDHDTRMIYLAGKGDGNIRYFELTPTDPFVHYLSEYQSPHPQRGLGVMPKLGLDTSKCEIFRFYKLHSNRPYCEPISMIAPRKAETFQEDLYPPTASDKPALSALEWISGSNRDPLLVNIRDPTQQLNNPSTVTSKPVRMPSQSSIHKTSVSSLNGIQATSTEEVNEQNLPLSIKNIRKLVGDFEEHNVDKHSSTSEVSLHKNGKHPSEQSLHGSSRGSDSVFERNSQLRRSDTGQSPNIVEESGIKPSDIANSKKFLCNNEKPEMHVPQSHEPTGEPGGAKVRIESTSTAGPIMLPHPPNVPNPHPHHNVHLHHQEQQAAQQTSIGLGNGAFKPVSSSRPQPPANIIIPADKPVSAGFVVSSSVSSPMSPTGRFAQPQLTPQQQENMIPSAQTHTHVKQSNKAIKYFYHSQVISRTPSFL